MLLENDFCGPNAAMPVVDGDVHSIAYAPAARGPVVQSGCAERRLIGGSGKGKTHLANMLGIARLSGHSKQVRFYSTVDLINALESEKSPGRTGSYCSTWHLTGYSRRQLWPLVSIQLAPGRCGRFLERFMI